MTTTNNSLPLSTPAQLGQSYAELYSEYFVQAQNALRGTAPAQAAPFKIFSLTNNNVNIVYSNSSGI